jgi:hypothetical protein
MNLRMGLNFSTLACSVPAALIPQGAIPEWVRVLLAVAALLFFIFSWVPKNE